jgi:hypothetical protein
VTDLAIGEQGGLRVEEVEWDQVVEIPSDGPQELIVEFRYRRLCCAKTTHNAQGLCTLTMMA